MSEDRGKVKNMQNSVAEFMRAAGQPVADEPSIPSAEVLWLRRSMLGSEFVEYQTAMARCVKATTDPKPAERADAIVEVADALADMVYVIYGAAEEFGIDLDAVLAEVCRSNDSKIDWANDRPWALKPSGKVAKTVEFSEPDLHKVIYG